MALVAIFIVLLFAGALLLLGLYMIRFRHGDSTLEKLQADPDLARKLSNWQYRLRSFVGIRFRGFMTNSYGLNITSWFFLLGGMFCALIGLIGLFSAIANL